jgi:hypothetical protein
MSCKYLYFSLFSEYFAVSFYKQAKINYSNLNKLKLRYERLDRCVLTVIFPLTSCLRGENNLPRESKTTNHTYIPFEDSIKSDFELKVKLFSHIPKNLRIT